MGPDWDIHDQDRDEDGFIILKRRTNEPVIFTDPVYVSSLEETKEIVFHHGYIAIRGYHMGDNTRFEKAMSIWDKVYFKYHLVGAYYVEETHELRVNRGIDTGLLHQCFPNYPCRVQNDAIKARSIDIDLTTPPRSDFQKTALTFMASQGIYEKNHRYTQQLIDADTGDGKSFCGVAITAFFKKAAVVIVPLSKLVKQWEESFTKFTTLPQSKIMVVQGSKSCMKIIDGKCNDIAVFIMMSDTIASFQKQYGNTSVQRLFEATGAYVKIVDEIHKDMRTVTMIEALSNFHMNYYMSASPDRSEQKESWMFKTLFRNVLRFGSSFKTKDEKHLNIMIKKYQWTPNSLQIRSMVNPRTGLNTKAYEKELINSPDYQRQSFEDAVGVMMNWSKKIVKPKNKIMVLAQSIDTLYYLQRLIEQVYPGETAVYYGTMKKKDKEKALNARVIIATTSSLGTGADIAGLQHVYNMATYANKIDAIQISGRCRALPDGTPVVYCEFVNTGYYKTMRQYEKRKPYLIKRTKSGKLVVVS